ncbi:hypothetical protein Rhom172_0919 [Rhodothermus marinus SG0.5JP17-172]|uniref:hypothetical protein n=1 Tax=Rhodothermus marinus TaxID=29549 RepID=UPI000223D82A|nr:hypothetical protein [Rhodothermus marinus]AEN72851.1 hypothetical protein Rhom172_0919 [Rhodothermus marinus SG0.5JP17-172]MBO2491678.1 hypothetical protein [Rhodothermus marinus]
MQAIFRLFARSFLRQWVLWLFVGLIILLVGLTYQGRLSGDTRLIASGLAFVIFAALALIQSYSEWLRPSWLALVFVRPHRRWQILLMLTSAGSLAVGLLGLVLWTPPGLPIYVLLLLTCCFGFALASWLLLGLVLLPYPGLLALCAILYLVVVQSWMLFQIVNGSPFIQSADKLLPSSFGFIQIVRYALAPTHVLRFCLEELGSGLLAFLGVMLLLRRRDIAHLLDPDT